MTKTKTRGFPALPTDDLILHSDQISLVHLEQQDGRTWLLLISLTDGRTLRIEFGISEDAATGDVLMDVWQQFEH